MGFGQYISLGCRQAAGEFPDPSVVLPFSVLRRNRLAATRCRQNVLRLKDLCYLNTDMAYLLQHDSCDKSYTLLNR